jgi:outer membrane protein assembly factor BamB
VKKGNGLLDSPLTPPAVTNGKLFSGTTVGEILCPSAATGDLPWGVPVGESVVLPPAVAEGRVDCGTGVASLIYLEAGEPGDDGWLMWGADADRNGGSIETTRPLQPDAARG